MANEKMLNTRILLKYDTLANWNATETYLRKGEVAIATVASGNTQEVNSVTAPQVLIKVGDGQNKFRDLPFITAKAGDVHRWAKEASLKYDDLPKTLRDEIDALQAAIGADGSVAEQITEAINAAIDALAVEDKEVTGQFVVAVPQADGKVAPVRRALAATDIPELAQSKITGLTDDISDLNSAIEKEVSDRKTAITQTEGYADQKVKALADGAVATNTAAIATINDKDNGILAQAKADATQKAADAESAAKAEAATKANQALADAKTYVDGKVQEINGAASSLAGRVEAIEKDYLVEADKTELANATSAVATNLANEVTRATDAEAGLNTRLAKVETFFELEEGEKLNEALDTLVEIQEYLAGEGEAADQLLGRVAQAEKDIDAIEADYLKAADKAELAKDLADEVARAKAAEKVNSDAIGVINGNIGTVPAGSTLVGMINAEATARDDADKVHTADIKDINDKIGAEALPTGTTTLIGAIKANVTAIADEKSAREAADIKHTNDIKTINDIMGEGTLTAGTTLIAAINANTAAVVAEKERALAAEAKALADAKLYTDALAAGAVKDNADAIAAINADKTIVKSAVGDDVVKAEIKDNKLTIDFDDTLTFILKAGDSTGLDATAQG